ncbi:MAG: hypothetical protein WBW04_19840 [Nitrolancea sp.]
MTDRVWTGQQERIQRGGETSDGASIGAWVSSMARENQSSMSFDAFMVCRSQWQAVSDVLRQHRPSFDPCSREDDVVWLSAEIGSLRHSYHVVAATAQLDGDRQWPHLVE